VLALLLVTSLVPAIPNLFVSADDATPAAVPQFTLQPTDSTYSENAATRFYVRAASTDSGYLSYQWHRSQAYSAPVANAATDPAVQEDIKKTSTAFSNDVDTTQAVLSDTTPVVSATTYFYYWVTVTNNKDSNGDGDTGDPGEQNAKDSALACVKVVDRLLPAELKNGDFEHWYMPEGITDNTTNPAVPDQSNTFFAQQKEPNSSGRGWLFTGGEHEDTDVLNNVNGWYTTHQAGNTSQQGTYRTGSKLPMGGYIEIATPNRMYGLPDAGHGSYTAELNADRISSLYQTVATVPGKIYEWSLDYGTRSVAAGNFYKMRMAVVIGKSLNGAADYNNTGTTPRYMNDIFPYGQNKDSYFSDIVGQIGSPFVAADGMHTVTYNGSTYYVYLMTIQNSDTSQRGKWFHHSGAYTVPAGQGTTIFSFVSLTFNSDGSIAENTSGNNLDNVVFASGTDLDAAQELTYTGETALTVPTKEGFAYALAELRGSSVNELVGLSAFYNGAAITPTEGLGSGGWYTTDSNTGTDGTPFVNGGTITFKDLVPSKTYRIIGIPQLAINTELQTNVGPGNVLDQGYYRDVRIKSAAGGDTSTLPTWDVELYDDAGTQRARITLKNTNAAVQYALLGGDANAPDTAAPALPSTAWQTGTSGNLVFEGLSLASTYWLVSRPHGYSEIDYADAAYDDAELVAVKIITPSAGSTDIDAASITREPGGTTIAIAAAGTRENYEYALADPASGHIVLGPLPHTGAAIRFQSLDSAAGYQVVCRPVGGDWLQGVRVLPYANVRAPLAIDLADESVKSTAASAGVNGFIPADVEFVVRADDGGGGGEGTWLVGSDTSWAPSTGTERLELAEPEVVNGDVAGDRSIFGALSSLAAEHATLSYRLRVSDSYEGSVVAPVLTLQIPTRPTAPPPSAFTVDYGAEEITAGGAALEWRSPSVPSYTALGAGAQVGFDSLGWNGAAEREVAIRFPVTDTAFASWPQSVTIPVRPDAPSGLTGTFVNPEQPGKGITIGNLVNGTAYQYSRDKGVTWTGFVATETTQLLPYDNTGGDYEIRFSATQSAPASFYATISSPLNLSALNLGTVTYGEVGDTQGSVVINNIGTSPVTLTATAITLSGTGSDYFTLNSPGAVTVPAASGSVGQNTSWTVTPNSDIPAGSYLITVNIDYTHDSKNYHSSANVYLTVNKATWNLNLLACSVPPANVTQSGFTVQVTGAPLGAQFAWALGGGAFSAPDAAVGSGGTTQHSFSGLAAASAYPVRVRVAGDANHNEVTSTTLVTGYTAQATPVALSVVRIDYANETLTFNTGFAPSDYSVTANDVPLSNLASLSSLAETGFTLRVVRRVNGPFAASAPATLTISGKNDAPSAITTTPASDDRAADGTIVLEGNFQYRASRNGADVTAGWTSASGSEKVTAGRYEVRRPPTATAFASKIKQVQVTSAKPTITLHTKTYVPASAPETTVVPGYLSLPAGWDLSTDPTRPGEYERAYLTSPLVLPGVAAVTSTSHVFLGWRDNVGLTGDAVTQTPVDSPLVGRSYWAKWVARPTVSTVGGVAPVADAASASQGLTTGTPVKLAVHLPAGRGTLALTDLVFAGASNSPSPTMYSSSDFSSGGTSNLALVWANDANYPTHAYVKAVSADDNTTTVYYDLTLYTTRQVSYTATQAGGTAGTPHVKTTTDINLAFSEPVTELSAANITVTDGGDGGHVVKGDLTASDDSGRNYQLAVSGVTPGTVSVAVADWTGYDVPDTAQQVSVYRDGTPPTGSITIKGNAFTEFLSNISFRLFFKETVDVTIASADVGGDGVASVKYLKRSATTAEGEVGGFANAEEAKAAAGWTAYTTPFSVSPNEKFVIYARITDNADNVSIIDSNGVVLYTDSAVGGATSLSYTKLSLTDVSTTLTLNDNLVKDVVLKSSGDTTLTKDTDYTIATDGTLTLKGAWLEARPAGTYTLEVSYLPLGADPSNAAGSNNQLPATSTLSLEVKKVQPGIELTADPVLGASYGPNNLTLRATITDPNAGTPGRVAPSGTVSFYKNSVEGANLLGSAVPVGDSPGVASGKRLAHLTLTLDAGTYALYAVYSGDGNFAAGGADAIMGYTVRPAAQGALVVHEGDSSGPAVSILAKKREDGSITLTATGGVEEAGDFVWASTEPSVATVSASGAKGATATVTLNAQGNTMLSVYRAASSNYAQSATFELPLSVAEEATLPVPGGAVGGGTAAVSAVTSEGHLAQTSVNLSWDKATDNNTFTTVENLRYFVYYSTSATNNISTPAECEANGTLLNTSGTQNIDSYTAGSLEHNTAYWFNVVVADEAGNKAAYTAVAAVTHLAVSVTGAAQHGGKNGRERSTGIVITFDKEVTGLKSVNITVSGSGVQKNGPITDAGDNDGTTWLVPIALDGTVTNGTSVTVTVANWANNQPGEDGHSYDVVAEQSAASATVYAPNPWPQPIASIDYANELITGLVSGGIYKFSTAGSSDYGPERTIDDTGKHPIPFNEVGKDISLVRVGVGAGVSLGDDELGYTDSPVQTLTVSERPSKPTGYTVVQPTALNGLGSITGVQTTWEYRAGSVTTYTLITATTLDSLVPGPYYLRVKATGSSFASDTAYVYIHEYNELNMGEDLEGYNDGNAATHETPVSSDLGTQINKVEWIDGNGVTAAEAATLFTLAGTEGSPSWTVKPETGLTAQNCSPTAYRAKIRITHVDNGTSEQDVLFTVHPHAQFATVNGAVASSVDTKSTSDIADDEVVPNGLTNTLTLNFAYPINLRYDDVVIGGAAHKSTNGVPAFRSVSDDKKTYVLDVTASSSYKTGDAISVTVKIYDDAQHAFQVSTTGVSNITPTPGATVTIPRAIASASSITTVPGYATSVIQFTLSKDSGYTPLTAPALLEWAPSGSYSGPIVLRTSTQDATPPATIGAVYRVDADKTTVGGVDQYWTFRILVSSVTASTAVISIPSLGITTPVEVTGGLSSGSALNNAAYFLNQDGYNYYTDLNASQVLPDFDASGGYVAGAYALPTSIEYEEGMSADVYLFKPGIADAVLLTEGTGPGTYTLSPNSSPAYFHFTDTPGSSVTLNHQLILTLNDDWTRAVGKHRLAVVFKKNGGTTTTIGAHAVVNVLHITPTWRLTLSDDVGIAVASNSTARSERGVPANTSTATGDFEENATVTLSAGTPNAGWRFSHWSSTPATTLPTEATGDIIMPAGNLSIQAHYTDGIAPQTTCDRASGTWLKEGDTVTLNATDEDVTPTGASGVGTVAQTWYRVDGLSWQPYSAGTPIDFGAAVNGVEGIHTLSFWSVDAAGNVEAAHEIELGFDKTAPTASLRLRGVEYADFDDNRLLFKRFYRGNLQGDLLSADAPTAPATVSSGVASVEYFKSEVAYASAAEVLAANPGWVAANTFTIETNWSGFIYARVTDLAGNVAVVHTDGIVRYTDSAAAGSTNISYSKTSAANQSAAITLNGNSVAAIADVTGGGTGTPLEPGTDYTVEGSGAVSFNSTWLQTLQPGAYVLELRFSPGGKGYIATQGNDAPTPLSLTLEVSRAGSVGVSLAAVPSSSATYGDQVELTATVSGLAPYRPGGTVSFYDGTEPVGAAVALVPGGNPGSAVATTQAVLSAGTHELRAEYSGDDNYPAGTGTLSSYDVVQANQGTPTIHYGSGSNAAITALDVSYGDASFMLVAQGGEGAGSFAWFSSNSAVASIDATTGEVGVVSVGSCTISVRRLGDDNHNASPQAVLALTVSPRAVTLTGISVEDKVYDGTNEATIIVPNPTSLWITGLVAGDEGAVFVPTDNITATFAAGADAGQDKEVTLSGFTLAGAHAGSYVLSAPPAPVTATIFKAVPVWATGGGELAASPLVFGQRLSASTLTGQATGINGTALAGSLSWADTVNTSSIPGSDAQSATNGLVSGGYDYAVTFTPVDTMNYEALEDVVTVPVAPAVPQMASGGAPVGSTIFAYGYPRYETLANSTITGDVVFDYNGVATALAGTWSWDDGANGAAAADISYASAGIHHPFALFMPSDPRVAPLAIRADLAVYSPRTEIRELPAFGPAVYGEKVEDVAIGQGGDLGEVLAIAADDPGNTDVNITAQGSWEWKSPDVALSSKLGNQQATLVFVPDVQADLNSQSPTGYLKAEATVTLSVESVEPSVLTEGDIPVIPFGQSLASASADIAQAGYVFSGVVALGEDELEGVLAFDDVTIVPGAAGYEADGFGSTVRESGRFVAQATFTPDAARYGSAYTPLTLDVELAVTLSTDTQAALEDAAVAADAAHSVVGPGSPDADNYDPIDVARFEAARTALEDALAAVGGGGGGGGSGGAVLTQNAAEQLLAELEAALAALEHDHPVIVHSTPEPITAFGVGVTIVVKGNFASVIGVSLDGRSLVLEPTGSPTSRSLICDGQKVGTLFQGSVIIALESAFVDTLPNGLHTLVLHFADNYSSGSSTVTFVIARDSSSDNGSGGTGGGGQGAAGGIAATGDANALLLALIAAFFMILAIASFAVALTTRPTRKR
jgi:hypothetical protein